MNWSFIKFLQANTLQYGQNGATTEVMAHLEKAIQDFQAVTGAWHYFLNVLSDMHQGLSQVPQVEVPTQRRRYVSDRRFRRLSLLGES